MNAKRTEDRLAGLMCSFVITVLVVLFYRLF